MTDSKQPRTAKPDIIGPLDQFKFALYASKDTRLSACDLACLLEIADRYIKKDFGHHKAGVTFPVGHTHLVRETGRALSAIKDSLARLKGYGYISVATEGTGSRGSEYVPNFNWSRTVFNAINAEIDARKATKKKRGRRASGVLHQPTNTTALVGRSTTPLRDIVGCHSNLLTGVVGCSTAPQTYVEPKRLLHGDAMASGTFRVPPPVVTKKIKSASAESEDGETWLALEFEERGCDTITLESNDAETQEDGQHELKQLLISAGLNDISEDATELIGCTVFMQGGRYVPAPDDMQDAA